MLAVGHFISAIITLEQLSGYLPHLICQLNA